MTRNSHCASLAVTDGCVENLTLRACASDVDIRHAVRAHLRRAHVQRRIGAQHRTTAVAVRVAATQTRIAGHEALQTATGIAIEFAVLENQTRRSGVHAARSIIIEHTVLCRQAGSVAH